MMLMGLHPETINPNYAAVSAECCPTTARTPAKLGKLGGMGAAAELNKVHSVCDEWTAVSQGEGVNIW